MPRGEHLKKTNPKIYPVGLKLNKVQHDFVNTKDNPNQYIRDLINRDMEDK